MFLLWGETERDSSFKMKSLIVWQELCVCACVSLTERLSAVPALGCKLLELQTVGTQHQSCRERSRAEAAGTALCPEAPAW